MSVEFCHIDHGVYIKAQGVIAGTAMAKVNDELYETPDAIKRILFQLVDFTALERFAISDVKAKQLAIQDRLAAEINPSMKIAVVGTKDLMFGMARMWESYLGDSPLETGVFRDVVEACDWLEDRIGYKLIALRNLCVSE